MKKRTDSIHPVRAVLLGFCLIFLLAAGGYFAMYLYYADCDFICGTWVNGIYCAGKSMEEVETQLLEQYWQGTITITDSGGNAQTLEKAAFAPLFSCSYRMQLLQLRARKEQTPGSWIVDTFHPKRYELQPSVQRTFEEDTQKEANYLAGYVPVIHTGLGMEKPSVRMEKTGNGYCLIDEKTHCFQAGWAAERIVAAVMEGEENIDLEALGCYTDIPYTEEERQVYNLWKKVEAFQDCRIVYLFGEEQEIVDASVVCDWIAVDESGGFVTDSEGRLVADEQKQDAYIDSLAQEYDTYGKTRRFHATRGETITIEGGTYGNQLNKKAEKVYIKEAFARKAKEEHEPEYLKKAWVQGKDDIGDTYIEIDMTEQTMYYYVAGECVITTPIVTGNMMRRRETPAAVCYIYAKQKNRILRGPGYASHVNFWMPVKGGIGIHDASWRKEFGGDIYKTDGSHGCINTPYEAVEKIFELAPVGTPVVMFY